MTLPTSLYTCRYWALGSGCPNVNSGNNICPFAHWDTGRLASACDQRGTCNWWSQGNCRNGRACYFEHRNTGVSGMYQGRLILNGLNLEVATAAGNAGFDTFNHAALYDLIWAVNRAAFRTSKATIIDRPRPPKDPVYPDRFRPSGLGDNTKRKRPAPQYVPTQPAPVKLETVVKPQRELRYRNRKAPARPKQAPVAKSTGYSTQGTQDNPVEVLSDDDDAINTATKRQKLNAVSRPIPRPSANASRAQTVSEDTREMPADAANPLVHLGPVTQDTMQIGGHTYLRTRHEYGSSNNHRPDEGQLQSLRVDLRQVKETLQSAAGQVRYCNQSMSTTFEDYKDILARPEIHSLLEPLGENFEKAKESLVAGVDYLNNVLERLG